MAFTETQQPARRRGRAKDVTKHEVEAARNRLRDAAAAGDVQACAALVALAESKYVQIATGEEFSSRGVPPQASC